MNHSGMETVSDLHVLYTCLFGCVRTIVVWKLAAARAVRYFCDCCVRTIVVWKLPLVEDEIAVPILGCVRTIVVWKPIKPIHGDIPGMQSCVRTIVVWKPVIIGLWYKFSKLRKNHSGMPRADVGGTWLVVG